MSRPSPSQGSIALSSAGTISATADILEVDTRTVSAWRSGAKRPSPDMRARIHTRLGIDPASWLIDAVAASLTPPEVRPLETSIAATTSPKDASAVAVDGDDGPQTEGALKRLQDQIARLKVARAVPGLSDRARVDFERLELAASRELARYEGRDLTLAQMLGSRPWIECMDRIKDVLHDRPWAFALVYAAVADDPAYAARVRAKGPELVSQIEALEEELLAVLA